jgi:ABC-type lipoprotein release transport system permease subunit
MTDQAQILPGTLDLLILKAVTAWPMALLGLLATWIPAQRALSVDPLVLLRDE